VVETAYVGVKCPAKPGNVVVLLVASISPVPSRRISTVTERPPRVVIVPETLASWSEGEKVNSAGP
jgi:hypothetical protein